MKYIAVLILLLGISCMPKQRPKPFIPKQCVGHITVNNFKKPCIPISDTKAVCDQVEITYDCVEYK